jgi:RHS repeat-associated protein
MANNAPNPLSQNNGSSRNWAVTAPQINLPKGGGAIRGIDEKFAANPVTGTGTLTVPIPASSGRSGFGPQLSLAYDSGSGNGPFGFGWRLSLPSITRRTDKGLPKYNDDSPDQEESDIFILSGAEDLVPVLVKDSTGNWIDQAAPAREGYAIKAYRPRTEGLFARIERWTRLNDGATHWRSISKDNIVSLYGLESASRISDPNNPNHVFTWLISESYDDKGNAIVYEYAAENDDGVDLDLPSERYRVRTANRYLKRIHYGNRVPLHFDPDKPGLRESDCEPKWMFSVVFDYGEDHYREEEPDHDGRVLSHAALEPSRGWQVRCDPFSTFRSTFEIRTYRLCRRVLMFHHFPDELGSTDYLVRSTGFKYREKPIGSFIERVIQSGHVLQEDGRYLTRSLPSLHLAYTESPLESPDFDGYRLQYVYPESLENLPEGIDGNNYRWVDLDGVGISGVLSEQDGWWFYKQNLGNGRLGAAQTVKARPAVAVLSGGDQHLMDLEGDGNLDLVDFSTPLPGFYERTMESGWAEFRYFKSLPVLDWKDPNLRFVDLTGDGIADILITEDDAYTWHPSLLREGFGQAVRVSVPIEEETGPRVIFADGTQSIYLADMTGDGLSDIVRIRNGEVCYWANIGRGRFSAKAAMDYSPWFDEPDLFDESRIRLADTDGSGTTDILYLGRNGVDVYLNQSGNAWSGARRIRRLPHIDNVSEVNVTDFLGRGTACLVWSSPLPREMGRQLRYIDLMCGQKPHLLSRIVNSVGAETRIEYASSTEFYLADKAAGTPWVTRLPFPTHVVKRVEVYDEVSRNRFVTSYTYHHGFYDGLEREFRGFGRVDQLDTEEIASLATPGAFPTGDNFNEASSVPPVLTKTWFHTGVFISSQRISRHLAHEYYYEDADAHLDDTILPPDLTPFEAREACRALKGAALRQEIYALDGTVKERRPYAVSESNFTIVPLQPRAENRYAVFFTYPRETIDFHYERNPEDPRIKHTLTLDVDDYGNVLKSVSIGYQRRKPEYEEQGITLAILTENGYTNAILERGAYRIPIIAEARTYELTSPALITAKPLDFDIVRSMAAAAGEIAYEINATPGLTQKRLIEDVRTYYRKNDLSALLPLGRVESIALPGQAYKMSLTPGLLDIFKAKASAAELTKILASREAEYRDLDGTGPFWIPSGQMFYSPRNGDPAPHELEFARKHFFLPFRFQDPFGNTTTIAYDEKYNLSVVLTRDAAGNEVTADPNYRVLQPQRITDPNGNRTLARFDALGMLAGTALCGKQAGPVEGDSFDDFTTDLSPAQVKAFFGAANPYDLAIAHLGTATTRIVYYFDRLPICAASIARETHVSALAPGQQTKVQLRFVYTDGFGREAQTKIQAEPGSLNLNDPDSPVVDPRWVGTGAKIYNNKGKPVREYEPFFSAVPQYGIEKWGVSNTLFYDAVERVVATLHPNNSFEKVVFDPWMQKTYDVNDTVTFDPKTDPDVGDYFRRLPDSDYLPTWYQDRIDGGRGPAEKQAAEKAAKDANTPTTAYLDTLGRVFLTVADNGTDAHRKRQLYRTRTVLDIEGNQREVIDPLDRVIMRYDYDMLSTRIHQLSMEAGERWMLNDVTGKPIYAWNSRGYITRSEYDELRRHVRSFVRGGDPSVRGTQFFNEYILFDRTIYGDSAETGLTDAERKQANLRGKVFRHFDCAGIVTTALYDFKGNSLTSTRQFVQDYRNPPDWLQSPALENEIFSSAMAYDALNRAIAVTAPDNSIYHPTFNDASLLQAVDVNLRGAQQDGQPVWTPFVTNINYDAKSQRTICQYANRAVTTYEYDDKTFRLIHLKTTRQAVANGLASGIFKNPATVQDLHYTYDPAGNITRIEDRAAQTVFHANQRVDPAYDYTYDPLYRLIEATGRENIGQSGFEFSPPHGNYRDYPFFGAEHLKDLQALRNYTERYEYDPVGNFLNMLHRAANGNWSRRYSYEEPSLIEPNRKSNCLSKTMVHSDPHEPPETYTYDANGNMTHMPHLPVMQWNFENQLGATSRQAVNRGEPATTYYVYDGSGQRARKVSERENGTRKNDRLYIGGFEIFRKFDPAGNTELERETLHVMDDKQRIALIETKTIDDSLPVADPIPQQKYELSNHLSSSILELDESGSIITYEEYSPYGNTTYQAGRNAAELSLKRYRYTGKERDEENGFSYHGARYYAPWLGRWTACDPAGIEHALNGYLYCSINPIHFIDKDGKAASLADYRAENARRTHPLPDEVVVRLYRHDHRPKSPTGKGGSSAGSGGGTGGQGSAKEGAPAAQGTQGDQAGTSDRSQTGKPDGDKFGTAVDATGYQQAGGKSAGVGGTGKEKTNDGTPLTEMDYATLLGSEFAPIGSEETSKTGVSGGIPGGRGAAWMASQIGQAAYIAVNLFFTFFGELVESGIQKTWSAIKGAVKEALVAPVFLFLGAGGIGGGSRRASQALLSGARRTARAAAIRDALESLRAETPTPQALHLVERLEEVYGRKWVVRFIKTGKLPKGIEFSHLFSASEYPEFAHRGDLGVLTDEREHRVLHHGGDTREPLHGFPRIPGD